MEVRKDHDTLKRRHTKIEASFIKNRITLLLDNILEKHRESFQHIVVEKMGFDYIKSNNIKKLINVCEMIERTIESDYDEVYKKAIYAAVKEGEDVS